LSIAEQRAVGFIPAWSLASLHHRINVHQLTSEQREELFEDLLVLKDTVPIEKSCPPEEEEDFA